VEHCTLDWVMGLGVYMPIPTILVGSVGAVPIRAIRIGAGGGKCERQPDRKDT
jgi:hypothetical protein